MEIKGRNIIVTGGLGCLGSGIVAALEERAQTLLSLIVLRVKQIILIWLMLQIWKM